MNEYTFRTVKNIVITAPDQSTAYIKLGQLPDEFEAVDLVDVSPARKESND